MLASLMDWPIASFLSKLNFKDDNTFSAEKEIDGGIQRIELPLNSILTCDLWLNTPRFPKLPNIMKAKKIPIEKVKIEDINLKEIKSLEIL